MKLPNGFLQEWNIQSYEFMEKFTSKRNNVAKLKISTETGTRNESTIVVKYFNNDIRYTRELDILNTLNRSRAPVPKLLYHQENLIVTEYIEGNLIIDEIFKNPLGVIVKLGDTLEILYDSIAASHNKTMIMGDMNLRNFIKCSRTNKIFRVDFETVKEGSVSKDIGQLCAFCISYDPAFTEQKIDITNQLFSYLSRRFEVCKLDVKREILSEISMIEKRRGIVAPEGVITLIKKW